MRPGPWRALGAAALLALCHPLPAAAQEAAPAPRPATEAAEGTDLLDGETLDALVAPVALYPDALLAQVLMAATYPLEIVKADRFLDDNAAMTDQERAEAAEAEDWDPSVRILAGGFPDIVARMADDIDWTEDLGDAMIAQTDDLLDAVQRMRAQAEVAGNLASNEAQTVSTRDGAISIAPADPERIYVPAYDPQAVYDGPAEPPVTGSAANLVATGTVAFGTALLLDDIFDDDDDCCWYGPDRIDWDDRDIHIDRDMNRDVKRDIDRNIDRDIDRNRVAWTPSERQRDAARERIAERKAARPAGQRQPHPEVRDARRAAAAERLEARDRPAAAARPAGGRPAAVAEAKARGNAHLKGKGPGARAQPVHHAPKQISRPSHPAAHKAPPRKPQAKRSAFDKPPATARRHAQAAHRGHASARGHRR